MYQGIRDLNNRRQIIDIQKWEYDFARPTSARQKFIAQFHDHDEPGWMLIRSPKRGIESILTTLRSLNVDPFDTIVVGGNIAALGEVKLMKEEVFIDRFDTLMLYDRKLCVVTVAGFQPGVEFSSSMQDRLIATWDCTGSTVTAVAHSSISVACGYVRNDRVMHFMPRKAALAYVSLIEFLKINQSSPSLLDEIHKLFETICYRYNVDIHTRSRFRIKLVNKGVMTCFEHEELHKTDDLVLADRTVIDVNPYFECDEEYCYEIEDVADIHTAMRARIEKSLKRHQP